MFLGMTDLAKGLLSSGVSAGNNKALTNSKGGDHYYTRGNITDRGPCPGLNALANQGYLFVNENISPTINTDTYTQSSQWQKYHSASG